MRVVVSTSCAVAGGAITHLRNLLPRLVEHFESGELIAVGDARTRERIGNPQRIAWQETETIGPGLAARLWFENVRLPRILATLGADVLFHPANFGVLRPGVPQVTLVHNLAPYLDDVIAGESAGQKVRLALLRLLTRKSLRIADRTIFVSRWGRSLVLGDRAADEETMPIIPFGSEHGAQSPSDDVLGRWSLRPEGFALIVSHLYRYKKIEKLVGAYEILGEAVMDLPLVVVGEPYDRDYADRLKSRAESSGIPLLFVGNLDAQTLATLMQRCRVFLFPSEAENLPITLLEAMAAGCAIVTNRACSMPEVCGDAVCYADPATDEEYARRLAALLENDALRSELAARASERALDFRWSRAAADTARVLVGASRSS